MPYHPQVQAIWDRLERDQVPSLYTLPLAEARAADLAAITAAAGQGEPVAEVSDLRIEGPEGELPVRVYRPDGTGPWPALVYYFGGGWTLGTLDTCDGVCRRLANAARCVTVAVGYRLAPEHKFPAAVHDGHAGLAWVAANAAGLGVDPARLAVGGDSAGGNLAAAIALLARDRGGPALVHQLLVYPNTDYQADTPSMREMTDEHFFNPNSVRWYWGHYLADPRDGASPLASPLRAGDLTGLPAATVITAEYDPLRDEGEQYAARLAAAGVPVDVTRYDGMMHGFFTMSGILDGARTAVAHAACAAAGVRAGATGLGWYGWRERRLMTGQMADTRDPGPVAQAPAELSEASLHASLREPALESMNFLNEVASRYPDAVSFASGRPFEEFFDVALIHRYIDSFCAYLRADLGYSQERVNQTLFQYGRTKGIVHELIARQLAVDEGIDIDPEAVVVTVGCQEAMLIVLRALRRDDRDVILSISPMYVGLTGAARLVDMPVWPVRTEEAGIDLADLAAQAQRARAAGLRPRGCYVMPDFANPSGASLSVEARQQLLAVAAREDLLLLEDNPYGTFGAGPRQPTLKALDTSRRVVYLGSFAKTGFPGARLGYALADQRVAAADGSAGLLADELSKIKSMVTVNTSAISQAVVGGKLLEHDCSVIQANQRETAVYVQNLQRILAGLARRFAAAPGAPAVTWNTPSGGFFIVITVPFAVDDRLLEHSARQYGVLWTPMSHFYDGGGGTHQVRLAYSQLTPDRIETGLDRFAAFVRDTTAA